MTDVNIDVSGEMQSPPEPKSGFPSFSQIQSQLGRVPNVTEFIAQRRQNIRSWSEFAQTSNFKAPASLPRLSKRIVRNIQHFQSNYLFVFIGLFLYCLITSPLLLLVLAGVAFAYYKIKSANVHMSIMGRELTPTQQCVAVAAASLPVLYIAGAGAAAFWVIGASMFVISLHAAFYNIDAIVTEDSEDQFALLEEV
ncbi:prenylated Rab acceptor protein 1-like [Ctenocephalides felis]|uniref:prenylated Rab acceptor protein 1-like n=1 Tax=Ctenocephalides felis TaxID=7515 RepID=UPI000E6E3BBC|nr:prenylated Rab acceptor protein 1-like [Ctenocephalides felis]